MFLRGLNAVNTTIGKVAYTGCVVCHPSQTSEVIISFKSVGYQHIEIGAIRLSNCDKGRNLLLFYINF